MLLWLQVWRLLMKRNGSGLLRNKYQSCFTAGDSMHAACSSSRCRVPSLPHTTTATSSSTSEIRRFDLPHGDFGICTNQVSSFGIALGYGLDIRGSILSRGKRFFSTLQGTDRLWDPPSLLSIGYWGPFPGGKAGGAWSWLLTSIYCEVKNGRAIPSLPNTSSWRCV
jgi:hypothetical protein